MALALLVMFVAVAVTCHAAWVDKQRARRNQQRVADRYAQPHRHGGQR